MSGISGFGGHPRFNKIQERRDERAAKQAEKQDAGQADDSSKKSDAVEAHHCGLGALAQYNQASFKTTDTLLNDALSNLIRKGDSIKVDKKKLENAYAASAEMTSLGLSHDAQVALLSLSGKLTG